MASVTGLITPSFSILLSLALNCIWWWIETGLGAVCFGWNVGININMAFLPGKILIVVSFIRSGYCSLRSSSDLMILSFWGSLLVWFLFLACFHFLHSVSTNPNHLINPSWRLLVPLSNVGSSFSNDIWNFNFVRSFTMPQEEFCVPKFCIWAFWPYPFRRHSERPNSLCFS